MSHDLIKYYPLDKMAMPMPEIIERIRNIEDFTAGTAGETRFEIEERRITRKARRLDSHFHQLRRPSYEQGLALAKLLDKAARMRLVHGDLHPKNVYHHDDRVVIYDWEPSLVQIVDQRPCTITTKPFEHPADRATNRTTTKTDMLCYIAILSGWNARRAEQFLETFLLSHETTRVDFASVFHFFQKKVNHYVYP